MLLESQLERINGKNLHRHPEQQLPIHETSSLKSRYFYCHCHMPEEKALPFRRDCNVKLANISDVLYRSKLL